MDYVWRAQVSRRITSGPRWLRDFFTRFRDGWSLLQLLSCSSAPIAWQFGFCRSVSISAHRCEKDLRFHQTLVGRMILRILILSLVFLVTSAFLATASRHESVPARESFSELPLQIENWRAADATPLDNRVVKVLGVDDYVNRIYTA